MDEEKEALEEEELEEDEEESIFAAWNHFAEGLINLEKRWIRFQELYQISSPEELGASIDLAKYASMYAKVKFHLMLPELVGHCIAYSGGLETLILAKEKED